MAAGSSRRTHVVSPERLTCMPRQSICRVASASVSADGMMSSLRFQSLLAVPIVMSKTPWLAAQYASVDLDPGALCRVDARYVGVGDRAREELLVAPTIRISLFEYRSAGVCRTVGTDPHARVECGKSYLCMGASKVELVFRACHHVGDDTRDGRKRHLRAFCVPYVTNMASPNAFPISIYKIDTITR